ncbi:MAG: hypothetical protein IKU18_02745 [Bacteroidales bacterium]|nr:hypothetical protein [Bacteroidales bacterium]
MSGFLKAVDPTGGALKIDEYLKAFHLGFLDFVSMPAGILLSAAEFVIGVCILKGIMMRLFSKITLGFVSFFTLLTLYSALFNPVQDCGCFGEAFHLTNWETFFKNVVLMVCALLIYWQRDKFKPIATPKWKYIYIGFYTAFIFGVSICALRYLPPIDFGIFKTGTLVAANEAVQAEHEYETVFTYSKEGQEKQFTLENLPDSTWTFVSADTKLVSVSSYSGAGAELILKTGDGVYVTEEILGDEGPMFLLSVYDYKKIDKGLLRKIKVLYERAVSNGARFYILSGNSEYPEGDVPVLFTDYKSTLSLNRSNGGLTYLNDGTVIKKWSRYEYPSDLAAVVGEDSEITAAGETTKELLFVEITLVAIFLLVLISRFVSKWLYKKSRSEDQLSDMQLQ